MKNDPLQPPPGWAEDYLSLFVQNAINNTFASFHNRKKEFKILSNIDIFFKNISKNLLNPKDVLPPLLLLRTHSAYLGACRMVLSGQIAETFVLLRSIIEYSLYALHIHRNPEAGNKWLHRHRDEPAFKAVRKEFTYSNVSKTLDDLDPSLSQITKRLYEQTIDFGAHPNERALSSSMMISKDEKGAEYAQVYLCGDTENLTYGLISTARVGLCALYIFRCVFLERFEILGIKAKMDEYRSML